MEDQEAKTAYKEDEENENNNTENWSRTREDGQNRQKKKKEDTGSRTNAVLQSRGRRRTNAFATKWDANRVTSNTGRWRPPITPKRSGRALRNRRTFGVLAQTEACEVVAGG